MTLLDLIQANTCLKKTARTNGGEYAGPCPFCGGRDRFRVWPNQNNGRFWCRGCGKHGDAIDYLREVRGLSFQEACLELGIESGKIQRPVKEKDSKSSSSLQWEERAESFLNESVKALWKNPEALSFLHDRGLREETIRAACLGWNPKDCYNDREVWGLPPEKNENGNDKKIWLPAGLVIPLVSNGAVNRLRIRRPADEPRYVIATGSYMGPMVFHSDRDGVR